MITLDTLDLNNPDIGEGLELQTSSKPKQDYSGNIHLIRKSVQRVQTLNFNWLPRSQALGLRALFVSRRNDSFTYVDYRGVSKTVKFNMDKLTLKFDNNNDATGTSIVLLEV